MTGPRTSFGNPSRASKGKGVMTSSSSSGYPWPREEGERFDPKDPSLPPLSDEAWDQTDAYYYNNWLDISIEPTRFLCGTTLKNLGLFYDVGCILHATQLHDMATQPDALYPDLVRQCLASAKLTYANPKRPTASEGLLSFFAGGKKHAITIMELCEVYGFDPTVEAVTLPARLSCANAFWNFIAVGDYFSRSAAQSTIRNPALRIGAKAISTILFAKDDATKVRGDELMLLYVAVRDTICAEEGLSCDDNLAVNMGALFAAVIADKRLKVAKGKAAAHTERMGSLLTRLFLHLRVDVGAYTCNEAKEFMDTEFLIHCDILQDATTYRFTSRSKSTLLCKLPQPSLTELEVAANVGFTPGTEYLCSAPRAPTARAPTTGAPADRAPADRAPAARAPKPRRSTSSTRPAPAPAPAHDTPLSQDEEEDVAADTVRTQRSRAHFRRPYASELRLDDISDTPDDAEYRRWMVASTKKNNGLLRRILHMIQKGCSSSAATETSPSTAPAQPAARPSTSARPSTRSAKRKKPVTSEDTDDTTSD